MIISMTGFGQAQVEKNGERFTVILKSVNHRYFETTFHLPPSLDHLESLFRSKLQEKIKRGKVNISVNHVNEASEVVVLNQELVMKYFRAFELMRKKLQLNDSVSISSLVSLPGVLNYRREELKDNERESAIKAALTQALKKLIGMRCHEGVALGEDLIRRVKSISKHMITIKKQVHSVIEANKKGMSLENLESFLRSTDVSEEITRIEFHLKSFLKHTKLRDPKGKVLDFIGQELQREINTLGAKVQDKHVAYQVVMVKDQIEKIREQAQNVE
ncbi:MAG: YicC family protein [Candidatus Omnitrophica bacterium CG1_02_44_16]|nr:MAG: YicC family protein [Candidatus Omnitrophica bacterium CG1_02_44_16]PIY82701.1 MAG: YicC family protein [Candidatus Omnitrophica bacterium CG_4_10_14_0_8_um_filter_44_12]PIZ84861.1 MAG: YicC family protein [Candidatus Omnitrophica bacterium CG_4_10_14_0_2_um_filter_44_9]